LRVCERSVDAAMHPRDVASVTQKRNGRRDVIGRPCVVSGAGNRVRTDDIQLGKLTLYQLSYARSFLRHRW
jgi:hypothetical protein